MTAIEDGVLNEYRVLDLTDERGLLCGKILGDMGADVIKVEKPGGDPARNIGPFYKDIPSSEKSLFWWAFNANKRGITLDIRTSDGREIFQKLVKTADIIIESSPPGYMEGLGLGYDILSRLTPSIVVTSITPFGQAGPYAQYKAPDIVGMAMGGIVSLSGDRDRPPVRVSFPQAYLHAGAEAAVGTTIALYYRGITGEGQHVDVSMQESVVWTMLSGHMWWEMNGIIPERAGPLRTGVGTSAAIRINWPCQDGHVSFMLLGGAAGRRNNQILVEWMEAKGKASDDLKKMDPGFDMAKMTQGEYDRLSEPIGQFFKAYTKKELFEEALKRRLMLYPLSTSRDIAEDPQLAARGFWEEVEHPELGGASVSYPGAFVKIPDAPCRIRRRAPLIGEHNQEVYEGELGLSRDDVITLMQGEII